MPRLALANDLWAGPVPAELRDLGRARLREFFRSGDVAELRRRHNHTFAVWDFHARKLQQRCCSGGAGGRGCRVAAREEATDAPARGKGGLSRNSVQSEISAQIHWQGL